MTGQQLGHYCILEKLGEGGMGVVYKARDTQLERFVAIKVLPPEKLANHDRKRRFIQEAKAASALNHPNIVTIHDIGTDRGADFMVMELVRGRTLDQVIPRGGMKPAELLQYAIPIADALARAHAAGIIHRDLKPGNIMIADQGDAKLLDFGLAKLSDLHDSADGGATRSVPTETAEGTLMGTASYMSPEQAEGRKVDARSDIFSFGAVLYEMATGRRAFTGSSSISVLAAILHTDPQAPAELNPGLPRDLGKIIQRCLRKDPAWRFQSTADLKISLCDLQRDLESGQPLAAAPAPHRSRSLPWIAALVLGLAVISTLWLFLPRGERHVYGPVRPLTSYSGLEYDPALSPDGKQFAFSWNGDKKDNFDIYVRRVDGGGVLRLTTDAADDRAPAWSPDGGRIAFIRGNGDYGRAIYVVPALGGVERKLVQIPNGLILVGSLSWSPDGKFIAFSTSETQPAQLNRSLGTGGGSVISLVSTETGEYHGLTTPPKGYNGDSAPAFSPDGRTLAFVRARDLFSAALLLQSVGGGGNLEGQPRELTGYDASVGQIAWLPDGRGLVVAGRLAGFHYLRRVTLSGAFEPLAIESGRAVWPSVSRDGNQLAYEKYQIDSNIYRMDGPGSSGGPRPYEKCRVAVVADSTALDREPMLSPDGHRLLFSSMRSGTNEIYVANSDGSNQVALTSMGPLFAGSPRWSPDGQTVVFDRYQDGHSAIYVVSAEGGKPRPITNDPTSDIRPSFSRDGQWIYFVSNRTGRQEIWKIPSRGGTAQQVTHGTGTEPFESSDGRELYYMNDQGVWSLPLAGGDPHLVLPDFFGSTWAVAGHSLYYGVPGNPAGIWVYRLETGQKFEYVRFPRGVRPFSTGTALTVSADERTIMYSQYDREESDLMMVENFR